MITRQALGKIFELIDEYPAVGLLGPRQIGKTTIAHEIAKSRSALYLDMQDEQSRALLTDKKFFLESHTDKLIIIDEVHLMPSLFPVLRGVIDRGRQNGLESGRFLLLGSASLDLLKQSGESLAGRIAYVELPPVQAIEVPQTDITKLWSRGGFPKSFLAKSDSKSMEWRDNLIRTYLEHDIAEFGFRIPSETMRRFWTMLAHTQSQLLNSETLAKSLMVSSPTIRNYLDLLVQLLLVRKLPPLVSNAGKRVIKSPKTFFVDSGLVHALLGIQDWTQLMGHPIAGSSWEAFVIENIIRACPSRTLWSFYRTAAGAEIDLVLELPGNKGLWAIEVKLGLTPTIKKGFYNACEDLSPTKKFIVYSGAERYPLAKNVEVIGLQEIVTMLQNL